MLRMSLLLGKPAHDVDFIPQPLDSDVVVEEDPETAGHAMTEGELLVGPQLAEDLRSTIEHRDRDVSKFEHRQSRQARPIQHQLTHSSQFSVPGAGACREQDLPDHPE